MVPKKRNWKLGGRSFYSPTPGTVRATPAGLDVFLFRLYGKMVGQYNDSYFRTLVHHGYVKYGARVGGARGVLYTKGNYNEEDYCTVTIMDENDKFTSKNHKGITWMMGLGKEA